MKTHDLLVIFWQFIQLHMHVCISIIAFRIMGIIQSYVPKGFPTIKAIFFKLHFSFENGFIFTTTILWKSVVKYWVVKGRVGIFLSYVKSDKFKITWSRSEIRIWFWIRNKLKIDWVSVVLTKFPPFYKSNLISDFEIPFFF